MFNTTIIGIGNLLLKDEGVGVHAIEALRERYSFPGDVQLLDGGTKGLDLLCFIEGDRLMLIDAVDFSAEPGTIRLLEGDAIHKFLDMKFSVHQIGVPDMLFAAMFCDELPPHVCLVGIQPESLEPGVELTDTLNGKMDELLKAAVGKLHAWGIDVKEAASSVSCDSI